MKDEYILYLNWTKMDVLTKCDRRRRVYSPPLFIHSWSRQQQSRCVQVMHPYQKGRLQLKANSACCNDRRCACKPTFLQSPELLTEDPHNILVVHPLVLLSVADHHARSVARGSSKRVVGVLLGQDNGKKSINVANSFGVPFEEDDKDAKTWFLDHNYVEGMFEMFKKVNGAYTCTLCR